MAQVTPISGIVNSYYRVVEVLPAKSCVRLNTTAGLNYNDKVMIVQMKGASINTSSSSSFGDTTSLNNAGNYEIGIVCHVDGDSLFLVYMLLNQSVVPGPFETWMMLLRDHGTLSLREVLEPAIFYARTRHPLVERASATIATVEPLFREHWKTSAAIYLPGGNVPPPGTMLRNPALAATYERILKEAESAGGDRVRQIERARQMWSRGFVAEAIDKFCRTVEAMDSSGAPHGGLLTADDMASWAPTIEAPATFDYGRFTVCKAGFWSQGPVLLQQLALLKGFDLDGLDPAGRISSTCWSESSKLAFADREKFYGDPNFVKVPDKMLLSEAYNDERRRLDQRRGESRSPAGFDRGLRRRGACRQGRECDGHRRTHRGRARRR